MEKIANIIKSKLTLLTEKILDELKSETSAICKKDNSIFLAYLTEDNRQTSDTGPEVLNESFYKMNIRWIIAYEYNKVCLHIATVHEDTDEPGNFCEISSTAKYALNESKICESFGESIKNFLFEQFKM